MKPRVYCPRTAFINRSSPAIRRSARITLTFSSRTALSSNAAGGSIEAVLADRFDDRLVRGRWCREIEEPVGVRAKREVELLERASKLFIAGIVRGRDEMQVFGEAPPDLLVQGPRPAVLRHGFVQLLAILLVAQGLACGAHDGERRGEQPLQREVVQRRDELALGEIAGAAEDHDRRRFGDA